MLEAIQSVTSGEAAEVIVYYLLTFTVTLQNTDIFKLHHHVTLRV